MTNSDFDVTVIGNCSYRDSIGRHIAIVGNICDDLKINVLPIGQVFYQDVPPKILDIIQKPFTGFGRVSFWNYILGINNSFINVHKSITSPIKIAYSMFESDAIPNEWIDVLNRYYDMVVVPDPYFVGVYKKCGVKTPVFVVPLGIMVEGLLARPVKTKPNDVFTFGMSAGFWGRKAHLDVLQAFGRQFGNDPKFKLRLHGRFGPIKNEVAQAVKNSEYRNVELLTHPLSSQDYDDFMDSLDCYTFISGGEGYSITPRESLALGKPCILSNNTAHKTICDSGFVTPVPANNRVPAIYEVFGNKQIGNYFKCNIEDVMTAMKDVANHYDDYLVKAQGGREWVKQSLWSSLKPTYLNLFKPINIQLAQDNYIDATSFRTSNRKLFNTIKSTFSI